jgi:hypothetical protein
MYLEAPIVARDTESQHIYVSCEFWHTRDLKQQGLPSFLQNDFLMQIHPTVTSIKTQGQLWVRNDGVLVNPETATEEDFEIGFQTVTVDKTNPQIIAEVEGNITRYWQRACLSGATGDQRTFHSLSEADPDGTLGKALAFKGNHDYPNASVHPGAAVAIAEAKKQR